MSNHDPFENFDKHFDKAFSHPGRTAAKWGAIAVFLNLLFYGVLIALVVGGILFLKAHGVF